MQKLNGAISNFVPSPSRRTTWAAGALLCAITAFGSSCSGPPRANTEVTAAAASSRSATIFPGERRFKSLRQLTFGGQNAEAYFGPNGDEIIYQATGQFECDQIFRMDADGANKRLVSTGVGRTTCSYIFPNQPKILYSSSHATLKTCPPRPDHSRGYVWPLLPDFEIYVAGPEGENPTVIAPHPGYDAEGVISAQGDRVLFTSTRSGDIDIWSMKPDGTDLRQLTDEVGYDGGAFFSLDGQEVVYRANHPKDPAALKDYKELLAEDLVRPSVMNLMVMNRDGSDKRVILANGAANFAPYFHPDGERIIFASNMDSDAGRDFDLYLIRTDGTGLERVTFNGTFDAFPMFSHDGTKLLFASNRDGKSDGETNVFIAEWSDEVAPGVEAELRDAAVIDANTWQAAVEQLADPALNGRGIATPGLAKAAELIAARFAAIGLEPAGDADTYLQHFPATTARRIERASLAVGGKAAKRDDDFRPFPFSASGAAEADAVFVGYGITSARHEYDDYAGIDATGKVAVAFRYEPRRSDPDAKFDGTDPSRESDLRFKGINARHHGAKALVVVNPPPPKGSGSNEVLFAFDGAPSDIGIPAVHLTWDAAARLFGEDALRAGFDAIEKTEEPASRALTTKVAVDVAIEGTETKLTNVVGRLPGKNSGRAVVVGAHYDHLGLGGEGSLAPGSEAPHIGADDNASGVAAMFETAEALQALGHDTDIYFVAFSGEESGLLGSHWFVEHPPIERERIEAMLNFDMVGRLRDGNLYVLGVGTAKGLIDVVRRAQVGLPLSLQLSADGYGPSDQMAFYVRKIPVLHFFTGAHEDYHRPSDTPEKLNAVGATEVTTFAVRILHELASAARPKPYIAVRSAAAGDGGGDGRRGYGPYFGSIPAFGGADDVKGVALTGARPGSPADTAGITEGDVIVKFGAFDVTTLRDYAFALRQHQPGDNVAVIVNRGGELVTLQATLGEKAPTNKAKNPHRDAPHEDSPHGQSPHGQSPHGQ